MMEIIVLRSTVLILAFLATAGYTVLLMKFTAYGSDITEDDGTSIKRPVGWFLWSAFAGIVSLTSGLVALAMAGSTSGFVGPDKVMVYGLASRVQEVSFILSVILPTFYLVIRLMEIDAAESRRLAERRNEGNSELT